MAYKSRGSRPRSPHTTHGSYAPSRSLGKPGAGERGTGLVLETSKMTRDAFQSNLNSNTGWKAVCIERMHARFGAGASKKGDSNVVPRRRPMLQKSGGSDPENVGATHRRTPSRWPAAGKEHSADVLCSN